MSYLPGHVKRDPETSAVAFRTAFPDDDPRAWLVPTLEHGTMISSEHDIESWPDLYVPEEA